MENNNVLTLVESSSSNVAYLDGNLQPYSDILASTCNGYTALNSVKGNNYLFQDTIKQAPRNIYIAYNRQFTCNDIPLNQLNVYDENNIREIDIENVNTVNVNNPIIKIERDKVKYFSIPESIIKNKIKYTINKTPYRYTHGLAIYPTQIQNDGYIFAYRPNTDDNSNKLSMYTLSAPYDITSTDRLILSVTSNKPSIPVNTELLTCEDGDYIAGWEYEITPLFDGYTYLNVSADCLHYDITSTTVNTTCSAKDDWPETEGGETASISCPTGYSGSRTRLCKDGKWQDIDEKKCEKIESSSSSSVCIADGEWPQTKSNETATLTCPTGYSGSRTRLCKDGKWQDIDEKKCEKIESSSSSSVCIADGEWPQTKSNETATLTCPTGYTGSRTRLCKDGKWQDEQKNCTETTSTSSKTTYLIYIIIACVLVLVLVLMLILMTKNKNQNSDIKAELLKML